MPVWGKVRPSVLVWLALESDKFRSLVSTEENPGITDFVHQQARRRGIPVIFPLLDLEDRANVHVSDVSGMFDEQILMASKRYAADVVVICQITRILPDLWEGQWRLLTDSGGHTDQHNSADSVDGLLEEVVDDLANALARIYAPTDATLDNAFVELTVSDIDTLQAYARCMDYLSGLEPVERLHVARVQADTVTFHLWVRGGRPAIDQAVALGKTLSPEQDSLHSGYRLLPWK